MGLKTNKNFIISNAVENILARKFYYYFFFEIFFQLQKYKKKKFAMLIRKILAKYQIIYKQLNQIFKMNMI